MLLSYRATLKTARGVVVKVKLHMRFTDDSLTDEFLMERTHSRGGEGGLLEGGMVEPRLSVNKREK